MKQKLTKVISFIRAHRVGLALGIVMAVAIFFRFWQLPQTPPGLYEDEAANGLDIFSIQDGNLQPFYPGNNGREALFFYLQVPFVWMFGNTAFALRVAPALIGVATVLVTYLWVKEWFSRRAALVTALFLATGSWAVTISRNGFRAGMVPLMIALSVWLFTKGWKARRWYWWLLTGLSLGVGFYTYTSYRLFPLALLGILVFGLWRYRRQLKTLILALILVGTVTILALAPLGIYGWGHRGEVLQVRSNVSITNSQFNQGNLLKTLASNVGKTVLMFNLKGDHNWRHNLSSAPMLNAFVGIMFIFGGMLALRRSRDIRYFVLLAILGVMLLPNLLTAEGIPHGLRTIGVIPVIYILAAIGTVELLWRWRAVFPTNIIARGVGLVLLLGLIGYSAGYDYQRYFVAWANAPEVYVAYSEDATEAAKYLIGQDYSGSRYLVIDANKERTVEYLTHDKSQYQRLEVEEVGTIVAPAQIVAVSDREKVEQILRNQNRSFQQSNQTSPSRPHVTLFSVYEISQ
ncbi:glycosyltransferase family 39 protein [Candidatus Microgenomates bacterium]|nr:glycosyltransferase family 39 protein [Candidatus Microgenomates bacterium]